MPKRKDASSQFTLREDQQSGVDRGLAALAARRSLLLVSPTGTGKSYIQCRLHDELGRAGRIISPSLEVIKGLVRKLAGRIETNVERQAEQLGIWTPLRLLNHVKANPSEAKRIKYLLPDEAHHDAADTYTQLYTLLSVPKVGCTATPYRATARETAAFLRNWDEQHTLLGWGEAAELGLIAFPEVHTVPLVDDDLIEIRNGDLNLVTLESETRSKIHSLAKSVIESFKWFEGAKPTRPTVFTVPSVPLAYEFAEYLSLKKKLANVMHAKTPQAQRRGILDNLVKCHSSLVQINTISEGADYPLRHGADMSPTLSPTRFVQRFGRFLRPLRKGEAPPVYVCYNRNIQHHGYLLRDILPPDVFKEAAEEFGGLGSRAGYRMPGLETFGKIKPIEVRTKTDELVHLYLIQGTNDAGGHRLACLLDPIEWEGYWFSQELPQGKWKRVPKPLELEATKSVSGWNITPPMLSWWNKDAERYGLRKEQLVDNRVFQILPILANCRLVIR